MLHLATSAFAKTLHTTHLGLRSLRLQVQITMVICNFMSLWDHVQDVKLLDVKTLNYMEFVHNT